LESNVLTNLIPKIGAGSRVPDSQGDLVIVDSWKVEYALSVIEELALNSPPEPDFLSMVLNPVISILLSLYLSIGFKHSSINKVINENLKRRKETLARVIQRWLRLCLIQSEGANDENKDLEKVKKFSEIIESVEEGYAFKRFGEDRKLDNLSGTDDEPEKVRELDWKFDLDGNIAIILKPDSPQISSPKIHLDATELTSEELISVPYDPRDLIRLISEADGVDEKGTFGSLFEKFLIRWFGEIHILRQEIKDISIKSSKTSLEEQFQDRGIIVGKK
jgi:hypothetical protein